jgi:hypothetical protein
LLPKPVQVETDAAMSRVVSVRVQQAFLPKFENEGQDSSIADAIVQQADERWESNGISVLIVPLQLPLSRCVAAAGPTPSLNSDRCDQMKMHYIKQLAGHR